MKNKGFTTIELIFSLIVCLLSSILLTNTLHLLKNMKYNYYQNEDETSIFQMQLYYALASERWIENDMLYFNRGYDTMYFEFVDDLLVLKEGYQVFMKDIKNIFFEKIDQCVYINYERDTWKKVLSVVTDGFMTLYAFLFLPFILLISIVYVEAIQNEIKGSNIDPSLHLCELYTIEYIKDELLRYEEENCTLTYKQYSIDLKYDDITCYIHIYDDSNEYINSCLQWDDIDNVVLSYTYL